MRESGPTLDKLAKRRMILVAIAAILLTGFVTTTAVIRSGPDFGARASTEPPVTAKANTGTISSLASTATFSDISPDNEGPLNGQPGLGVDPCPEPCASQHNGGRVNGLAAVPGIPGFTPNTYYAASEVGGLFKSVNGGASWSHLDSHVPNLTWDIAARPGGLRIFATSFYDGRIDPLTGIQVSTDGGGTWDHPSLIVPPGCAPGRRDQPSGFGIALRPGASEVFVGTNCGLARSSDDGASWTRFDPTPDDGVANSIWDVVALPGGRTYACGNDGLLMSQSGQPGTWTIFGKPTSKLGSFCSLAVSPDEPTVVYVVFGGAYFADIAVALGADVDFYEGRIDESGAVPQIDWTKFPYPDDHDRKRDRKIRVPFVVANNRSPGFDANDPSDGFDLWVADGSLWRIPCHNGQIPRCPTDKSKWFGSFTDHLDATNNNSVTTITVQCVVPVAINIKPHGFPNAMNLNGFAPTAVLTTRAGEYGLPLAFDATKIKPESVFFGPASLIFSGTGGSTATDGKGHIEDSYELDEKTRDRDLDMVFHFPVGSSGLLIGSTQACVKGKFTGSGGMIYEFFGCDSVTISP